MRSKPGFTNQQALLLLMLCIPLTLLTLGVAIGFLQRPDPEVADEQAPRQREQPLNPVEREQQPNALTQIQQLLPAKPSASSPAGLSEQQALTIVEQWLGVKSQVFAPPFNTSVASQLIADGPLWTDLTKPGGSIQWLKNNNSYYTYNTIRVNRVVRYLSRADMPSILVSITESSVLHSPNGSKASTNTNAWLYTLKEEEGRWKIWDYRKQ